jgi:predicted Rdx family selenoprotein
VADVLRQELGVEAEMVRGSGGIFVVSVDGAPVARKTMDGFPTPEACLAAVKQAMGR